MVSKAHWPTTEAPLRQLPWAMSDRDEMRQMPERSITFRSCLCLVDKKLTEASREGGGL